VVSKVNKNIYLKPIDLAGDRSLGLGELPAFVPAFCFSICGKDNPCQEEYKEIIGVEI